jgi:hypothetical protein
MDLDADVRWRVYRAFVETGAAPTLEGLAGDIGVEVDAVAASLERLQLRHTLVLAPGTANIWMAHPFSAVPTPYTVSFSGRRYWANCAWDYFAIPSLIGASGIQTARCAQTGDALQAEFESGAFVGGSGVVHFTVPVRRFWDNVAFT